MKRRTLLAGALAASVAAMAGCRQAEQKQSTAILFSHSFPDTAGVSQAMAQWQGKPLLVNFWATWCAPCVKEMPDLDQLSRQFPNIAFVGIGIDSAQNIAGFIQKVPVRYPLLEARAAGLELMRTLGNDKGGLPFTVIIGADGRLIKAFSGQIKVDELQATLRLVTA